jgi:hypothetical protein
MDTVNFQCDFCGDKSEGEQLAGWARPHCSIEMVLRGRRFMPASAIGGVYGVPLVTTEIEDERWGTSLCDRCMKRLAAFLGLRLETPEEFSMRQDETARRVASDLAASSASMMSHTSAGMRGELVQQFPTSEAQGQTPQPGGLVAQFPNEPSPSSSSSPSSQEGLKDLRGNAITFAHPESGPIARPGRSRKKKSRRAAKSALAGGE